MLQAGIVGLPNVGKSTLFNALTRTHKAAAENYPFCTIEPNIGRVEIPEPRLKPLAKIAKTENLIPAAMEFVDIAGLVEGASKGQGLGNQFLSHIRNVEVLVHMVRCFEEKGIIHEMGSVDPLRDIQIIAEELILADLESVEVQIARQGKKARSKDKNAVEALALLRRFEEHFSQSKPALSLPLSEKETLLARGFGLLSAKRGLYACNVSEDDFSAGGNTQTAAVKHWAEQQNGASVCVLCARVEQELSELPPPEAQTYLKSLGIEGSGVENLIQEAYKLLGLRSFFTAGEKEARAWTFHQGMNAAQCAGVIHTDFEKHFIKADVISCEDLLAAGGFSEARKSGKYRLEGKDYLFCDGDVALFKTSA